MTLQAFQDYYPDDFSHCYGCGELNEKGHHLKSYWDNDETVATYTPDEHYVSIPGFVYGGLIASLIDCHSTGTAAAASYQFEGRDMDSRPALRFVTASLKVDYHAPTPLGKELELRSRVKEVTPKKVVVETKVRADGIICASGTVVAVRMPRAMLKK